MFIRKGEVLGSVLIKDLPKDDESTSKPKAKPKPESAKATESDDSVAKSDTKSADKK